ncbi:alpha-amylase family glycosyl hydrolase [Singulisphaera sp. Ch08]|uniref:1,4-alpha-glucan branching enzyme n=1 Tax=Singulisphaera sp. Ch08 TaxID=3120278 RepID=A0AAU7CMU2_9BACT
MISVRFTYLTGLKRRIFRNARLAGSWNGWAELPMTEIRAEDGCPGFTATVEFNDSEAGREHRWGVRFDGPGGANMWAINLEVSDGESQDRFRTVTLPGPGGSAEARYYFTDSRRLGAQKTYAVGSEPPDLKFAVWAPNARSVEVVFGRLDNGYITDGGVGIDPAKPRIALARGTDGLWESAPVSGFSGYVGLPYMFRIENAQGNIVYRTDIHSRWQLGRGDRNPVKTSWDGNPDTLDGTVSCSVIIDQDIVRKEFEPATSPPHQISDQDFWAIDYPHGLLGPTEIQDLVIYELHIGSLGYPGRGPGTLADAMDLLDYLSDLGVNAVELLPISEFSGNLGWGYGDTHHFVIESSAGGRDKYKHFVRACHRRGIAVIQDVVYNHFDQEAERAEWAYDSTKPEENIYYWYEGRSTDHPFPAGGYLDNGSSGFTPRFWEEPVRQMFISSAAEFIEEFHVDGLRVDLTQAIHRDNRLKANGWSVRNANLFGQKFLREWSRTLRMIRPAVMLVAEDHTGWDAVTKLPNVGGLGFDTTWFAEFYHHLIGDSNMADGAARLLHEAGFGHDGPLAMEDFAGRLWASQFAKVAYHESHDEAGNADGSLRTSRVAVNDAALFGATRTFAEARSRVAAALSILSAATPMFFMGEEVVAQKRCKFDNIATSKEDLKGERTGNGAKMFRYYQDLIRLRRANPAVRSHSIDVVHVLGANRVIAFTRRQGSHQLLIVASLNNRPFEQGYVIQTGSDRLPSGLWLETFNSDAGIYGGGNVGNYGAAIPCNGGRIELKIPANGVLVLQRL